MEYAPPESNPANDVVPLWSRVRLLTLPQIANHLDQRLIEQCLMVFVGTVSAMFAALRVVGQVNHALLLWPVSGAALGLSLSFWSSEWQSRLPLQIAGTLGALAGGFLVGMPAGVAISVALLTGIDMILAGAILSPHVQCLDDLKTKANLERFLLAALLCPLLTGLLGAAPVSHTVNLSYPRALITVSVANSLGFCIVLPLMLSLITWPGSKLRFLAPRTRRNALLYSVLFLLSTSAVFYQSTRPFLFCIFPVMLPVLLTLGLEGAILISVAVSAISWFATAHGHGPFTLMVRALPNDRLIALQLFNWVCLATALPIGALLDDRRSTRQDAENAQSIIEGFQVFNPNFTYIKDLAGCYVSYNTAFADFYGIDRTAWVGRCSYDLHPPEIANGFRHQDQQILERGQEVDLCEQFCGKDGRLQTVRHRKFAIVSANGTRFIGGIAIDMTADIENQRALTEANARLQQLARIDNLTGLPRRHVFEERLALEFAVARRTGRPLALLFIDLDNFKKRNDELGHKAGDDALQLVGRILGAIGRLSDLPARFGGEEFVFLLPETSLSDACLIAERLLNALRELDLRPQPLTASIGVSTLRPYTTSWQHLLARADEAMYEAKTSGKNRVVADRCPVDPASNLALPASIYTPSLAAAP